VAPTTKPMNMKGRMRFNSATATCSRPRAPMSVADVMSRITMRGFNEHVPRADRLVDAPVLPPRRGPRAALDRRLRGPRTPPFEPYGTVPKTQMWRMSYGLFMSQMPWHQPKNERLPAFAGRWFEAYDRGVDVTHWFGSQHRPQPDQR